MRRGGAKHEAAWVPRGTCIYCLSGATRGKSLVCSDCSELTANEKTDRWVAAMRIRSQN